MISLCQRRGFSTIRQVIDNAGRPTTLSTGQKMFCGLAGMGATLGMISLYGYGLSTTEADISQGQIYPAEVRSRLK